MNRSPCAVCDRLTLVREQRSLSADQLPNEGLLRAYDKLNQQERARITFTAYWGDTKKQLENLVLGIGFFEYTASCLQNARWEQVLR